MITIEDILYELPEELIAVSPSDKRETSRLLIVDRKSGEIRDGMFTEFPGFLKKGDCLVMNDTRVFHARLMGKTAPGVSPARECEILLVEKMDGRTWKALVKNSKKIPNGTVITCGNENETFAIQEKDGEFRRIEFGRDLDFDAINRIGEVPLPPYILKKRKRLGMPASMAEDDKRYQSVMAKIYGSVAAPTASFHFTENLLEGLRGKGVEIATVTLHVGPGTFKPVDESIENYVIHREEMEVPPETIAVLKKTRENGGRIIAVGTTVVRSLETMAACSEADYNGWKPYRGETRLFIRGNYPFQAVDMVVTNFHMPKSTLLLLVYAFGGKELIKKAYRHAVENKYRFLSYGDAMLIG